MPPITADPPSFPRVHRAWRSKWRFIAAYWVLQAAAVHVIRGTVFWGDDTVGTWADIGRRLISWDLLVPSAIVLTIITSLQAAMFLPVRRPGMTRATRLERAVHCTLCALAIAGVSWLAMWLISVLLDEFEILPEAVPAIDGWLSLAVPVIAWIIAFGLLWSHEGAGMPVRLSVFFLALGAALVLAGVLGAVASLLDIVLGRHDGLSLWIMVPAALLGWIAFTPLLMSFCQARRAETALGRLSSLLFLGTIVEAAAVIPLDVMVRRKTNCYCGEGTFWALSFCAAVGALALGPAIFLIPLSGRRKRWYHGVCEVCGYDMTGSPRAERCPECGAGWKPAEPTSGC